MGHAHKTGESHSTPDVQAPDRGPTNFGSNADAIAAMTEAQNPRTSMICERPLDGLLGRFADHRFIANVPSGDRQDQPGKYPADVYSWGPVETPNGVRTGRNDAAQARDTQWLDKWRTGEGEGEVNCIPTGGTAERTTWWAEQLLEQDEYAPVPGEKSGQTNSNTAATGIAEIVGGDGFNDTLEHNAPGKDKTDRLDFTVPGLLDLNLGTFG